MIGSCNHFKFSNEFSEESWTVVIFPLVYFAWHPYSLVALFMAPIRFTFLPAGFTVMSTLFACSTALLVSELEPYPEWPFKVFQVLGLVLSLKSLLAFFLLRKWFAKAKTCGG